MNDTHSSDSQIAAQSGPDRAFQEYLSRGEFCIQKCSGCERFVFYPRILCPYCGGTHLYWVKACGTGVVYATSVPRSGGHAYNIALVELTEGPRMMTRVVDIDPFDVTIGMSVTAFIGTIDDNPGKPLVLFRPDQG